MMRSRDSNITNVRKLFILRKLVLSEPNCGNTSTRTNKPKQRANSSARAAGTRGVPASSGHRTDEKSYTGEILSSDKKQQEFSARCSKVLWYSGEAPPGE